METSENLFHSIVETASDALAAIDSGGKIIFWNRAAGTLFGYSAEEMKHKHLTDLMPEGFRESHGKALSRAFSTGQSDLAGETIELSGYRRNGTEFPLNLSLSPWKSGEEVFFTATIRDVTEGKQAEEALRESEEKYRQLVELSLDSIAIHQEGKIVFINTAGARQLGAADPEQLIGKPIMDFLHPDYHDIVKERIQRINKEKEKASLMEEKIIRLDGTVIDVNVVVIPSTYQGKPAVQAIARDITERKQAEAALRESEEKYRAIFEQAADSIVLVDAKTGELVEFNDRMHENLGYTREEFEKLKIPDFEVIESADEVAEHIEKIVREGTDTFETKQRAKDGEIRNILINSRAISIHGKDFIMSIWRDFTEHKQAEEALRETQDKLIRAERLAVLGQLAGGVGHELRNPLGAIKNATYFLNMVLEEPEPEVKQTLEILEKEVGTSEKIISSLLDFARPKPPTRRKVNLNEVVQEALSRVDVPENVKVVSQLDEALPTILVDPDQLDQVFGNIIFNGIQAMPEGGRLTVQSEAPDPKRVAFAFTDTGEGIPDENLEKLFEPLFTTRARGIGLGLALARILVVGHGGTIEVDSEVDQGSTFTVWLPVSGEPAIDSSTSLGTNSTEEEGK